MGDFREFARRFAQDHQFTYWEGNFPKEGRPVLNGKMQIDDETFISFQNFLRETEIEMIVYSHFDETHWRGAWNDLLASLRARFGAESMRPLTRLSTG